MASGADCIFLRVFAECGQSQAHEIADHIETVLLGGDPVVTVTQELVEEYWRIKGTWDLRFKITVEHLLGHFDRLLGVLGEPWDIHKRYEEAWAVWDEKSEGTFCHDAVVWANLEIVRYPKEPSNKG